MSDLMCATESSATDLCSLFWCPYSVCMCMNRSSGHTKFNLAYVLTKVERGKRALARRAGGGARTGVARSLTIPNRTCSVAAGTQSGVRVSPASRDAATLDHIVPGMQASLLAFACFRACALAIGRSLRLADL